MTLTEEEFAFLREVNFDNVFVTLPKEILKTQPDIKHNSYGIGIAKKIRIPMVFKAKNENMPVEVKKILAFRFDRNVRTLGEMNVDANEHKEYYQMMGVIPEGEVTNVDTI